MQKRFVVLYKLFRWCYNFIQSKLNKLINKPEWRNRQTQGT